MAAEDAVLAFISGFDLGLLACSSLLLTLNVLVVWRNFRVYVVRPLLHFPLPPAVSLSVF